MPGFLAENSMNSDPINLVTTRPDSEVAAELLKRAEDIFDQLGCLMDDANAAGLALAFAGMQLQAPMNRHRVVNLSVVKHFWK
jgi:hypothetical protein